MNDEGGDMREARPQFRTASTRQTSRGSRGTIESRLPRREIGEGTRRSARRMISSRPTLFRPGSSRCHLLEAADRPLPRRAANASGRGRRLISREGRTPRRRGEPRPSAPAPVPAIQLSPRCDTSESSHSDSARLEEDLLHVPRTPAVPRVRRIRDSPPRGPVAATNRVRSFLSSGPFSVIVPPDLPVRARVHYAGSEVH